MFVDGVGKMFVTAHALGLLSPAGLWEKLCVPKIGYYYRLVTDPGQVMMFGPTGEWLQAPNPCQTGTYVPA